MEPSNLARYNNIYTAAMHGTQQPSPVYQCKHHGYTWNPATWSGITIYRQQQRMELSNLALYNSLNTAAIHGTQQPGTA